MEENIEFKDREYRPEEDLGEKQQETSFWDSPIRQQREKSLWETPDAPKFEPTSDHPRLAAQREELEDLQNIELLKKFLIENLGVKTSMTAGEESKNLYDNCKLVRDKRSGKISGDKYKDVKVVVDGNRFSENKKFRNAVEKFKLVLQNAEREYNGSLSFNIDSITDTFDENVDETVKRDFIEQLERDIKNMQNDMQTFMAEKEQELQNRENEIKKLNLKLETKEKKKEKLEADLAEKNSEILKLTRELGTQAISQGKELAEKEREKKPRLKNINPN